MQSTTDNVSDSTPPTHPTRFKWKWILYGIIALAYLPQLPGCLTAHASKFGRVVDADTGKGMAGIIVIASADISTSGGAPFFPETLSSFTTEYRVVTTTDKDGKYWIHSTWIQSDLRHFLPLFGDFDQEWHVIAFRPGYVMDRDYEYVQKISRRDSYDQSIISGGHPSVSLWLGALIKLKTTKLIPTDMTVQLATAYYDSLLNVADGNAKIDRNDVDERRMASQSYHYFLPKYCSRPENDSLDMASSWLMPSPSIYLNVLRNLEPENFQELHFKVYEQWPTPKYRSKFKAGDICTAMKAAGETPS